MSYYTFCFHYPQRNIRATEKALPLVANRTRKGMGGGGEIKKKR